MMHEHQVGQNVQYVADDDHAQSPAAGVITTVHPDGSCCLAFYCTDRHGWYEAHHVKPFADSDGDTNQPYFQCLGGPPS
jgi:hypothetical protein